MMVILKSQNLQSLRDSAEPCSCSDRTRQKIVVQSFHFVYEQRGTVLHKFSWCLWLWSYFKPSNNLVLASQSQTWKNLCYRNVKHYLQLAAPQICWNVYASLLLQFPVCLCTEPERILPNLAHMHLSWCISCSQLPPAGQMTELLVFFRLVVQAQ